MPPLTLGIQFSDLYPLRTRRRGVPYFELVQGLQESLSHTERRTTRVCRIKAANYDDWVLDMLGDDLRHVVADGHVFIRRTTPDGQLTGGKSIYAIGMDWMFGLEPYHALNRPRTRLNFLEYVYALQYASLPYDVLDDNDPQMRASLNAGGTPELLRYVERQSTQAVEALAIPGGQFKMVDDATPANRLPLNEPPPKALSVFELTYIWHRVPAQALPVTAIKACAGRVNSVPFDAEARASRWPFRAFPAGTLLCGPVDYRYYTNFWNRPMVDVVFKFSYRDHGLAADGISRASWNHVYRHQAGTWALATHDGLSTGRKIYEAADFNTMFFPT